MGSKAAGAAVDTGAAEKSVIDLTKVNVDYIDSILRLNPSIKVEVGATLASKVGALQAHIVATVKEADLVDCDVCGGESDTDAEACPYCGTGDDGPVSAPAGDQAAAPAAEPKKKGGKAKAVKGGGEKGKGATSTAGGDAPEGTDVKSGSAAKAAAPKGSKAAAAPKAAKPAAAPKPGKAALALAPAPAAGIGKPGMTIGALDKAVVDIHALKAGEAVAHWLLGKKIKEIFDTNLWKLRESEPGKPRYTSFEAFCREEIKMSPTTCYDAMDLSAKYTEDEVREFGSSKLVLILKAPPEAQGGLVEQTRRGNLSKRQVADAVAGAREKAGVTRRETGRKPTPNGNAGGKSPGNKKKRSDMITVASIEGTCSIDLFCKPARRTDNLEDLKPAKRLADVPFGYRDLENNVRQWFSIVEAADGHLKLKIETVRNKD